MAITTTMSVHTISFRGISGGIFITLTIATVLYVIGFATTAWSVNGASHEGLWESCRCGKTGNNDDWFRGVQAMMCIGLVGLLVAFILVCLYMCVHSISKNTTIIALVVVCFLTALFMAIGFIIYGVNRDHLNWSFVLSVIACILCAVAGVLSIVQMRQSGVRM